MEKIKNDGGFNLVITQCDGCGREIANLDEAETNWITVEIKSLSRDEWSLEEDSVVRHFCTEGCFHDVMGEMDPHQELAEENQDQSISDTSP